MARERYCNISLVTNTFIPSEEKEVLFPYEALAHWSIVRSCRVETAEALWCLLSHFNCWLPGEFIKIV